MREAPLTKRTGRTDLDASPTLPFNGGQLRDALKARIAMPSTPPLVPTRDSMPPPMIMAEEPPPLEPIYELREPKLRPQAAVDGAHLSHPPRARNLSHGRPSAHGARALTGAADAPVVHLSELPLVHTGVVLERPMAQRAAQSEHRTTLMMLAGVVALLIGLMVVLQ